MGNDYRIRNFYLFCCARNCVPGSRHTFYFGQFLGTDSLRTPYPLVQKSNAHLNIPMYNTKVYQDLKNRGLLNREFTYLTPLAYHYQDDWAREVNDFLLEYIDSKPIYRMQYDFMEFIHVFRDIYILYHEDISAYVQQLRQIKNQLGKLLSEYFEIIYVDCDLNRAKRENDRFVQAMVHQYQQARKLYLHMIKTEPFRAFFMKNS